MLPQRALLGSPFDCVVQTTRSDDAGAIDYDIEPAILEDMAPHHLFIHDVACFAEEAVDRMKRDWKAYRKDYRRGAFTRRFERYG